MSEFIIDLSEVEKSSDRFKFLFNESIPLGKRIVRCRDCKHYENTGNCHYWASYEPIPGGDEYMEMLAEVTDDGFCAWGERK